MNDKIALASLQWYNLTHDSISFILPPKFLIFQHIKLAFPHPSSEKLANASWKYSVMRRLKKMNSFGDATGAVGIHTNCFVGSGKKGNG